MVLSMANKFLKNLKPLCFLIDMSFIKKIRFLNLSENISEKIKYLLFLIKTWKLGWGIL